MSLLLCTVSAEEIDLPTGVKGFLLRIDDKATAPLFTIADRQLSITPDANGRQLTVQSKQTVEGKQHPSGDKQVLMFLPPEKQKGKSEDLPNPRSEGWKGRWLAGRIDLTHDTIKIWLEGRLILNQTFPEQEEPTLKVKTGKNTEMRWVDTQKASGLFETLPLTHLTGENGGTRLVHQNGIPFEAAKDESTALSLANAAWPEWESDPGHYQENYDGSSRLYLMESGRVPFVQVPKADYIAAHLLATAEEKPGTINRITLRFGRQNGEASSDNAQMLYRDFAAEIPYGGAMRAIRVPLPESFAQNIKGDIIDLQITKELRLARRSPDPSRFRWRPLGLPSNVKIAAITLEKSPLQMEVIAGEQDSVFVQPHEVNYRVRLTNLTKQARKATVEFLAGETTQKIEIAVPAHEAIEKSVTLNLPPGHYPLQVSLSDQLSGPLLRYQTRFGVLPPDTRHHRAEAPWGTWDFGGSHFTPNDPEAVGKLMQKLGLRYGMFRAPADVRMHYGVIKGNDFKIRSKNKEPEKTAERYAGQLKTEPDLPPDFMVFHEDAISGPHATRTPDLFHSNPPYLLNADEKDRFAEMWKLAATATESMRKAFPEVKIHLGNGGHALREEFYRNGFPSALFDTGGNESAGFGRPPESQPPDGVAINAALWMDRQLLDAYGYQDKSVSQANEVIYPATNPGNLSLRTQADYFIRHILHAMAWKIPKIRPGSVADMGNSYYQSNWGGTGFMFGKHDWSPKPSAIALATLTRVLDGAAYHGSLETGSDSVYLLNFKRKDGEQVYPFWTVRGERPCNLAIKGATAATIINWEGREKRLPITDGKITLTATASPAWLSLPKGAVIETISLQPPVYPNSEPQGKISDLSPFDSIEAWTVVGTPSRLLNHYNPMTPRRKGEFTFETMTEPESGALALKVTPRPLKEGKATMPTVVELVSNKAISLPGKPTEIGLYVKGNSSWGRIIFELEDASGQRWTSIGARSKGGSSWMADWLGEELNNDFKPGEIADWNTDDVFGLSRINFDGWRYLGFPLPGQYPGEGYHWPFNSQWRWDKDGKVHYPLTLKKVIVELPEKVLYLDRFEPPKRPEIWLKRLISVESDIESPKSAVSDYVESAQVTID